jgi:hypothetical protein
MILIDDDLYPFNVISGYIVLLRVRISQFLIVLLGTIDKSPVIYRWEGNKNYLVP